VKVIDASALVKYVNREIGWETLHEYIIEGCITLDLALKELGNALWKRIVVGEVRVEDVLDIMQMFIEGKIVKFVSQGDLFPDALRLSVSMNITVYDALYIILAKRLKTYLITSNKKQAEVADRYNVRSILV